jgi:DNA-binding CsgD family transcriptional regulator
MFENPEAAFGGTSRLLSVIETLYAAVGDRRLWDQALGQVGDALGCESIAIYAGFPDPRTMDIIAMDGVDPAAWSVFASYYAPLNPVWERSVRRYKVGETCFRQAVISDIELERTEIYADFYKKNEMHHMVGMLIPVGDLPAANLSCHRAKSKGMFEEHADVVLQTLRPHLSRALMLHDRMSTLQSGVAGLTGAMDAFDHAVFGLDRMGRVVLCNRRAEELATTGDALTLRNGMLHSVFADQNRALQRLLRDAVATGAGSGLSAGGSMLMRRPSGQKGLPLTVTPFQAALHGGTARVAALVFVGDPSGRTQTRSATLRALYGLTPSEARVADLLAQGMEVGELAARLGITLPTARFHVKRILGKTGTGKQSLLMKLMLSLPHA